MPRNPESIQRIEEYRKAVEGSTAEALEVIRKQVYWLSTIPERDLKESEREKLLHACERFYETVRYLTEKYYD